MTPNVYALLIFFIVFVQSYVTQPFEFVKSFEGSQKGGNVEGLHKIKKYLQHFGYLSIHYSKDDALLHNSNDFDDVLESAIKTFQLNFNLHVTGTLNAETVALMATPRCGVPDIIDGMNSMLSGRSAKKTTSAGHQNKLAHTLSHYVIPPVRGKWPKNDLTYAFKSSTPTEAMNPIIQAFKKWTDGTADRFTFQRGRFVSTSDIIIIFAGLDHGDNNPFDGPNGTIAHASFPTDGEMHFDKDEKWSVKPIPDAFVYETVALHEIGHLLGLNHSSNAAAAMYPYCDHGEVKTLQQDDLDGIKDLYG